VSSFSTIIIKASAAIVAAVTGYFEVKKITLSSKKELHEMKSGAHQPAPEHHGPMELIPMTGTAQTNPVQHQGYYMDYNSGIFIIAVFILPLIYWLEKRKKRVSLKQ
jgi:hypothetical protein